MRVPCASGSRPAQISPSAIHVLMYPGRWWPQLPLQSVLPRLDCRTTAHPPWASTTNTKIHLGLSLATSIALNRDPFAWCSSTWLLTIFIGIVTNNPTRKLAGRQLLLFLFLPGCLNIHNRATWRRVHRRNGAPMRKARLFMTWVSGAGETIQDGKYPIAQC